MTTILIYMRCSSQFWDNKVLPTQVMPEEARAEKKW